jgi:hypothetical protein
MDSESPLNRSLYAAQQGRATRPLRPIAAETKLIGYYFKQLMAVPAAAEISRLIMAFYKDERLALFIDGANLYSSARALGLEIDFRKFLKEFQGRGRLLRASYYTALVESDEYSPIRPLVDWLAYNGFSGGEEGRARIYRPRRPQTPPRQYGRRTGRRYARSGQIMRTISSCSAGTAISGA